MKSILRYVINRWRFRGKNIHFPISCKISINSLFEGSNTLHEDSQFQGYLGFGSYIGPRSHFYGRIGRFSSLGSNVDVLIGIHPYTYPYVSTSPMFYSKNKQSGESFVSENHFIENRYAENSYPVIVGNDVWINSHVRIVSGVKIGDGAVILAGTVVTKDVPPYAIIGGIPSRILRYRYSKTDIEKLMSIKWWNKDLSWIKRNATKFNDSKSYFSLLAEEDFRDNK